MRPSKQGTRTTDSLVLVKEVGALVQSDSAVLLRLVTVDEAFYTRAKCSTFPTSVRRNIVGYSLVHDRVTSAGRRALNCRNCSLWIDRDSQDCSPGEATSPRLDANFRAPGGVGGASVVKW